MGRDEWEVILVLPLSSFVNNAPLSGSVEEYDPYDLTCIQFPGIRHERLKRWLYRHDGRQFRNFARSLASSATDDIFAISCRYAMSRCTADSPSGW